MYLFFQHFDITDKVGILDYLYAKFDKSRVATFTETLAKSWFFEIEISQCIIVALNNHF